jgi:acetyl esterase/lipase
MLEDFMLAIRPYLVLAAALAALSMSIALAAGQRGGAAAAAPASAPAGITRLKLWETAPGIVAGNETDANPTEPTMDIYLPPADKATGAAVMVLPGGGYSNLSMTKEGSDVARMWLSHNVAAFVVRYRHAPRYHYPIPLLDAQRALRTVRSKAEEYHIDPNRIGILGFSAGGHLAASVATMYDSGPKPENPDAIDGISAKPNFAILMYPVIDFTDNAVVHKGSRTSLTQDDSSLFAQLSPQLHVTRDTPPVFLVHGTNDRTVPVMNSILFYEACLKAGVPAEMHIFENGPHGFGLAPSDPALKTWPDLAVTWLERKKFLSK